MREQYDTRYGKYNNRMAAFVDVNFEQFDRGDNWTSDGDGEGALLIGKRVLSWDNRGFVGIDKFPSVVEAASFFETMQGIYEAGENDNA